MTSTQRVDAASETLTAAAVESATISVAELVGTALARLGVAHVFGVVGSGNFAVTNALIAAGVPYTAARHEGGAATMADAFARMSGRLSVVTTHQGCGLTNAITGITEAAKSRTPMIVLTADSPAGAVRSNFLIDQTALARSVGAVAERVHSAATALADTVRAYRTAVNDRRTVVLNLSIDVGAQRVSAGVLDSLVLPLPAVPVRAAEASVTALVEAIAAARRPVFVAGRGARSAGVEIAALAEASGALVATSAVANGLFQGEAFSLGISGGFSSPLTAEYIRSADLIVGWGCTLNMWTMRHGTLIGPDTVVVQVDLDDDALGANRAIDLGVRGDCGLTATDALTVLSGWAAVDASAVPFAGASAAGALTPWAGAPKLRTPDVAADLAAHARWQQVPVQAAPTPGRIDPRTLTIALDALLPRERIVSIDSGNFMGYPSTHLTVPDEFGFCFTQAFQSIGLGLATAVGAALAQPERLPVLGTGDGGFFMAIAELETAVRLALPLVVIVYNDAAYGAEVHHFAEGSPDVDLSSVTFPDVDAAAIARGYGATGLTVRHPDDLAAVTQWLASAPAAPLVIDAKIASDGGAWWLAEAFAGH